MPSTLPPKTSEGGHLVYSMNAGRQGEKRGPVAAMLSSSSGCIGERKLGDEGAAYLADWCGSVCFWHVWADGGEGQAS